MKTPVAKLTGRALDYAVALAEGGTNLQYDTVATYWITINGKDLALSSGWAASMSFAPSSSSVGDDIIDREMISTTVEHSGVWLAYMGFNLGDEKRCMVVGSTRREAAMRCYVASKLGAEVEIPKELA